MKKKIQSKTAIGKAFTKVKVENNAVFPGVFSSLQSIFFEEEESKRLPPSIEPGIGQRYNYANEFKEVYEHLRKDYPEFVDKTDLSLLSFLTGRRL